MNALWQKIQELREEHKIRHNQFWEDHKAWQQQNQEERRLKYVSEAFCWPPTPVDLSRKPDCLAPDIQQCRME